MHFFQVKLKLPLSEFIISLKVIIDLANCFRAAEYGADCQVNLSETNYQQTSVMYLDRQLM